MKFNENEPLYLQIIEEFKKNIISCTYPLGSKVESVRNLALEYGVNPNTVQRALAELERMGLVETDRTNGRNICRDAELIKKLKIEEAVMIVDKFIADMQALGFDNNAIIGIVEKTTKNKD